jgi:hypothetical protein
LRARSRGGVEGAAVCEGCQLYDVGRMQVVDQCKGVGVHGLRHPLVQEGGALAAMESGLSQAQIQDLGRWASANMVGRYTGEDPAAREAAKEAIRL